MNVPPADVTLPTSFAGLATSRRWVAWQQEDRLDGKTTKVPYSPGGGKARADDPRTWGTHEAAEARAAQLAKPYGLGGVGIELGGADNGRWLAGADLDTCRDPETGLVEPWALAVVERLGTYAEISPSETGMKAFFLFDPAAVPELRAAMGTQHGKTFKHGGGEHPRAIELHISNRYFAVTGEHLAGTPGELRPVPLDALLWLLREAGPALARGPRDDFAARIARAAERNPMLARRWGGDWSGLNDASGSGRAMALGTALRRAGFDYADMRQALHDHPDTRDWADAKGEANGAREMKRVWQAAGREGVPIPGETKRPLYRDLPPTIFFPLDALGALKPAAEAIHTLTQAPIAICAQSVLAAATLAIQAHRDVELPGVGIRPLTAIFISVADSGERKSAVDRHALRPVNRYEEGLRHNHKAALLAYRNALDAWEDARAKALKGAKGDASTARAALNQLGPEPKAPPSPMFVVADPTPEGLILHLAAGRPWGGVFTAEAGLLIGGHAFNDETKMRTGALLNVLWDGEAIRRQRAGTGAHFLPGRRCSVHLMMQHNVAAKLFGDTTLAGIGTLARTLLVAPESTAGTRLWRESDGSAEHVLLGYTARLGDYLARIPRYADEDGEVLNPLPLTLHADARRMWTAFHDAVERALQPEGKLAGIRAFASKMPEHAGRLAGILAAYAEPDGIEIGPDAMANGIALTQHYAAELGRLMDAATVNPDLTLAARLLTWWQARPNPRLHLAAIYQRGLNAIGDAATARRIVTVLQEHGYVSRLPEGTKLDGSPRRDAWELVP